MSQLRLILSDRDDPEPGLRVAPAVEEHLADPRGIGCPVPLSVVLDVDLALLVGSLFVGRAGQRRHPFLGSLCEDCEADDGTVVLADPDGNEFRVLTPR